MPRHDGLQSVSRRRRGGTGGAVQSAVERTRRGMIARGGATGTGALDSLEQRRLLSAVTVGDVTVVEGTNAVTAAVFPVTLDAPSETPVVVKYTTLPGTAKAGKDFVKVAGSVVFAPGETQKSVSVNVIADAVDESDEQFRLRATKVTGGTTARREGTATIQDDDSPVLSVERAVVIEGNNGVKAQGVVVRLSGPSGKPVTVNYSTLDGTAVAGEDYVATSGAIKFNPGQTSRVVPVGIRGDTTQEPDETFRLVLANPVNASLTESAGGSVKILTDDGVNRVLVGDASLKEGSDGDYTDMLFPVRLLRPAQVPTRVTYETVRGENTFGDFVFVSGTVDFAPGESLKAIAVPIVGDRFFEGDETFAVRVTGAVNADVATEEAVGTILDDDAAPKAPPVKASVAGDVSVVEGNPGTTTSAVLTVTLDRASDAPVTVYYRTVDGTATDGSDYAGGVGAVAFAPGETSKQVTVAVTGDDAFETDETFSLQLEGASNALVDSRAGVATITNDDLPGNAPAVGIAGPVTVAEGNSGTTPVVFTVQLSHASDRTVTVNYATQDGSAAAGSDYAAASGTLTFAPGETSKTVTVLVNGDTVAEADENFLLVLSSPSNAFIAESGGSAAGTIHNDDAGPVISVANAQAAEGNSGSPAIVFTVTLSGASASPVTVNYQTANGTATAGSDYTAAGGTLTFAPGETSKQVSVAILPDTTYEGDETFTLALSSPSGATIDPVHGSAVGKIIEDDPVPLGIVVADVFAPEHAGTFGNAFAYFTVRLTRALPSTVTVNYATSDVTTQGPADYTATSGTLTFAPGETAKLVAVPVVDDEALETNERFALTLSNASGAPIVDGTAEATIIDDDALPYLIVDDSSASVTEGDSGTTTLSFDVVLVGRNYQAVTVNYATQDGTATAGSDYVATSGTLTFPIDTASGFQTQTVTVTVNGDLTQNEAASLLAETFQLKLTNPTNATILQDTGIARIEDDDELPTVFVDGDSAVEKGGTLTFNVFLTHPYKQDVTVSYQTVNGTATAGSDFVAASGTVVVPAGQLDVDVPITLINDTQVGTEAPDETFELDITGATNAVRDAFLHSATGNIRDDDQTTTVSVDVSSGATSGSNGYEVDEPDSGTRNVRFRFTLGSPLENAVTVNYSVGGAATGTTTISGGAGNDYVRPSSNSVVIPAGQTEAEATFQVIGDLVPEGDEDVVVTITGVSGDPLADPDPDFDSTSVTIVDNDNPFLDAPYVIEGAAGQTPVLRFTIRLKQGASGPLSFQAQTADGTAVAGTHYQAVNVTVPFTNGQQVATVDVPIIGNDALNPNRTLTLNVTGGGYPAFSGVGTIYDDDDPANTDLSVEDPIAIGADFVSLGTPVGTEPTPVYTNFDILNTGTKASRAAAIKVFAVAFQTGVRYEVLALDPVTGQPLSADALAPAFGGNRQQLAGQVIMQTPDGATVPAGYYTLEVGVVWPGDEDASNNVRTSDLFPWDGVPRQDVVTHLAFDDAAHVGVDTSGTGIDGSPVNSPGTAAGVAGAAVTFNGTDQAIAFTGPGAAAALSGSFSMSLWLKTMQTVGTDNGPALGGAGILYADDPSGGNDAIPVALTGSKVAFATNSGGSADTLRSSTSVNDGNFHHVVVTYNAATGAKRIYVDGDLAGSSTTVANGTFGARGELVLGGNTSDGRYFNGTVDDLQVYRSALTPDEVFFLFENPGRIAAEGFLLSAGDPVFTELSGTDDFGNFVSSGWSYAANDASLKLTFAGTGRDAEYFYFDVNGRVANPDKPLAVTFKRTGGPQAMTLTLRQGILRNDTGGAWDAFAFGVDAAGNVKPTLGPIDGRDAIDPASLLPFSAVAFADDRTLLAADGLVGAGATWFPGSEVDVMLAMHAPESVNAFVFNMGPATIV